MTTKISAASFVSETNAGYLIIDERDASSDPGYTDRVVLGVSIDLTRHDRYVTWRAYLDENGVQHFWAGRYTSDIHEAVKGFDR